MANTPNLQRAIGNEAATTLSSSINDTTTSITVADGSVFNSTGGYAMIDEGNATEEVVYIESVSGNTLTVATDGRGKAGTSAASHNSGATITDIVVEEHINGIIDQFEIEHADDGTHTAITGTSLTTTGAVSVGTTLGVTGASTLAAASVSGDLTVADAQDITFTSGAKIERDTGHLVLTPETSKLVKIAALRQDDTTNTYSNNQVILTGWGYITATAVQGISETVTFGVTFADIPIVVVSGGLLKSTATAPTSLSDFNTGNRTYSTTFRSPTSTDFELNIYNFAGNFTAGQFIGYTWTAIGTLS